MALFDDTFDGSIFLDNEGSKLRKSCKAVEYETSRTLPPHLASKLAKVQKKSNKKVAPVTSAQNITDPSQRVTNSQALVKPVTKLHHGQDPPQWHPPWKLMRVIAGHLGWVRCVAVDRSNEWFATGSADRTIKIWDLAAGTLKLTLTGHSLPVRGLALSDRHPYMFSVGEDKMVKLWDLEHNKAMTDYHGHKGGVYTVDVHPTLDLLVTGGRDSAAKLWDIRTRTAVHTLAGHNDCITTVKAQASEPQIITASFDKTVRLWDIRAGKSRTVLTHHRKGVRALALHPDEYTFASASTGSIKQWKCPEGSLMQTFEDAQEDEILNSLSANSDGVCFAGGNNGTLGFYDWKTGHNFQKFVTTPIPGSLDSERGILASSFDRTGSRLITCESDKSIKMWREDPEATEETHPLKWKPKQMSMY